MTGWVVFVKPTPAAGGDRPWWIVPVQLLAVLPAIAAVAVLIAARTMAKLLRQRTEQIIRSPFTTTTPSAKPHWSPSPLVAGGIGALIGYRLGGGTAETQYSQMRLQSTNGEIECRYLAAPDRIPVHPGDQLNIWGSFRGDDVLRGYRLENLTSNATHHVTFVGPWVASAAAISALLCLAVLASVI